MNKAVVILSGGLDSTVLTYYARTKYEVQALSIDYGQRHVKELDYAKRTCVKLNIEHEILDLMGLQHLLSSSLTFSEPVPEGHYAQDTMKRTIVPNRNAILLSVAYGWALSSGATRVLTAVHAGDHAIYPDCRPEFFQALQSAFAIGSIWQEPAIIERPFQYLEKSNIVFIGRNLGVPFEETWSCYQGLDEHCGRCGTCVERAEAFSKAGVPDPTIYQDPEFWKQAVKEHV